MQRIRKNKGITLIALILTIVVMLILAGVGISVLTNNDGMFNKVSAATKEHKKQTMIEAIRNAETQMKMDYMLDTTKSKDISALMDKLKEISNINEDDYKISPPDEVEQTVTIIDKQTGVVIDISMNDKGEVIIDSSIVADISDAVKPTIEYTLNPAEGTYGEEVEITVIVKEDKKGIVKLQMPDNTEKT